MSQVQILLVGCGKMGGALLEGWAGQQTIRYDIHVLEPAERLPFINSSHRTTITHHQRLEDIPAEVAPDIILFAVKPQTLGDIVSPCFQEFGLDPLYISIAAGRTIGWYHKMMDRGARIIRAMPNTPALVGRGVTVMVAGERVSDADRALAQSLMEACGLALWLEEESSMDAVTAISGSGPAYVFYFMECLMRAALDHGLEEEMARTLVMHTVLGSAELAFLSNDPIQMLRRNVTSPGGTTEAALEYLMNPSGMLPLIQQAVEAAIKRAAQLSAQK